MKRKFSPFLAAGAALVSAFVLVACGGSDDETPAEDPALVPSSATGSTSAWLKFASALVPSESAEALQLTNVSESPTSETDEPAAVPQ